MNDSELETVPCDLCGVTDEEFLFTKNGVMTGHPFRVVRCRRCGLLYLNPRLHSAAIARLYAKQYYDGQGFDRDADFLADFEPGAERPARMLLPARELAPPPARLLDFGSGLGALAKHARDVGYDAEGFEISSYGADFGRKLGLTVYTDYDAIPSNSYDIVMAMEVLEHCASPTAAIATIHRALKPGGVFYYTTGNFDGYYRRWKAGRPDQACTDYIMPEGHIYFFSTPVMRRYFAKTGFSKTRVFRSSRYNRSGPLYRGLARVRLVASNRDYPVTLLQRTAYGAGRALVATLTGQNPLPIAFK